jgi:hypothetical protein
MAGYLDSYGVKEGKREHTIKRVVIVGLSVAIVVTGLYFWLHNYRQEQVVKHFFSLLQEKKYQEAYALWGCTQDNPCKYWSPERFNEEWGPASPFADVAAIKIVHEDSCGNGVVFDIESPKMQPTGLFVNNETNQLSYYATSRCPGKHLQLFEFIKQYL